MTIAQTATVAARADIIVVFMVTGERPFLSRCYNRVLTDNSTPATNGVHTQMTDETRMTDIEARLAYQEAAIDDLTRASLEQQRTIEALQSQLMQAMKLLRDLTPGVGGPAADEPPPPHY